MALVPIRIDRTSKPPLGTPLRSDGHWSVQGLVGAWAFNEGAGKSVFDAVSGGAGITKGGNPWVDPMGLYGDGAGPEGVFLQNNIPDHTSTTMICTGTFSTFSAAITLMVFRSAELTILATGAARTRLSTSGSYPSATSTALPATVTSLAATLSGVGIHPDVYVNGRMKTSTSTTGSGLPSAQIYSSIGCGPNSESSNPLNGCISSALRYNIILPTDRISSISANPWQIYEPETVWIEVGGGGAAETRNLIAAITGQSTTPSIQAATLRTLLAAVSGGSVTSTIQATLARALLASVIGSSLTPGIAATLSGLISLVASIPAQSLASTAQATINRALTAAISGQSGTPSISALIHGVISLVASVSGQSSTPSVAVTTARLLLAAINGGSSTAASRASADRSLAAIVSGQSNTPGVAAMLANMVSLAAGISAHSTTPAALATLQRDMMAAIHAATSTGIISASTSRAMSAVIEGQSLAPDNIMATLAGLGLVLDTSIESRTIIRTLRSLTKKYTIHSI